MKIKRLLAITLALCMTIVMLAACGSSNPAPAPTPASGPESTPAAVVDPVDVPQGLTLVVLTHRTDRDQDGSLAARTAAFEETYNCTVEYVSYTDYATDASTVLNSANWGDVMMIPSVDAKDLSNFFEPLGTYEELSQTYNWVQERMFDGIVYGMPHAGNVSGGFNYNKRIWAEAGAELPTTPAEFVAALEKIAAAFPGEVVPLYTNYSSPWTAQGWQSFGESASGDPDWKINALENGEDLFVPGSAMYEATKLLFDVYSNPALIEADPSTADWEACKALINEGKIATIVLESWATGQFAEAGPNPDDIGFAPVPFTVNGKQYAVSGGDYHLGVNVNSSADNKALAKAYVFWFVDESGFAASEGMLEVRKGSPVDLPGFENVEVFSFSPDPEGLGGVWDEINTASEVNFWNHYADNQFLGRVAELAFAGAAFSEVEAVFAELNANWAAARDANADLQAYLG